MLESLEKLADESGLWIGLAFGAGAAVILLVVRHLGGRRDRDVAGLLFAVAAVLAQMVARESTDLWMVAALVVLGVGGALVPAWRALALAASVAGAIVLVAGLVNGDVGVGRFDPPSWQLVAVALVVVVAVMVTPRADDLPGWTPWAWTASFVGVFITVPDTELALPVAAALVPWLAVARPAAPTTRTGAIGAAVLCGLLAYVAVVDGRGRPGAVVGALSCFALLVIEPTIRRRGWRPSAPTALAAIVVHGVLVLGVARVAGLRQSAADAAVISAVILTVGAMVWWLIERALTDRQTT